MPVSFFIHKEEAMKLDLKKGGKKKQKQNFKSSFWVDF